MFRRTVKCGVCKRRGHNSQTCGQMQASSFENENFSLPVNIGVPETATSGVVSSGSVRSVGDAYEDYVKSVRSGEYDVDDVFNPYRLTRLPKVMSFSSPPGVDRKVGTEISDGERYTLEELSTLWELTLESDTSERGHRFGWQQQWWEENFDALIGPLQHASDINVEGLRVEMVERVKLYGGSRELSRYLIKAIRTATSEDEEVFYLKTLATIWPDLTNNDLLTIVSDTADLPFPVYNALLESGYSQVLAKLNEHYISKLSEESGGGRFYTNNGETVFPPTPLTRTMVGKVSRETLIAAYSAKVREVLDERGTYENFPTSRLSDESAITVEVVDFMREDFEHLRWKGSLTEEEYETKMVKLNNIQKKMERGGGRGVTREDFVNLGQVFKVGIGEGARLIPEREVVTFYFNGSYRDKQMAVAATKTPRTLKTILTNTNTPEGVRKSEWWEQKKTIIKTALERSSTRIDKETFNYIVQRWGHEKEIKSYMLNRLQREPAPFPSANLTTSEWYSAVSRLKNSTLKNFFKKGFFGWFHKRITRW